MNHMDKDQDNALNYKEFCGFSEEKRRNIDPFDSVHTQRALAKKMGLSDTALEAFKKNPYGNI